MIQSLCQGRACSPLGDTAPACVKWAEHRETKDRISLGGASGRDFLGELGMGSEDEVALL